MSLKPLLKTKGLIFIWLCVFSTQAFALALTQKEQDWIKTHSEVTLGADKSWPPYDFKDAHDRHVGMAADFLQVISKKTGLRFKVETGVWSEVMAKMRRGELDGLTFAMETPDRKKFLYFAKPYLKVPLAIIVEKNRQDIRSVEDLKGKIVAVTRDSYLQTLLKKNYPGIILLPTESNEASLEAVSFKKADAYIGNIGVSTYIINEKFITNLRIVDKLERFQTEPSIAISKKEPVLFGIIEKAIESMTPVERSQIILKWFNLSQQTQPSLDLTPEEKAWLETRPKIQTGGEFDWAPFDFVNEKGVYTGITKDYLDLISQRTGLQFEFHIDLWQNLIDRFKSGELDLLTSAYSTPERKKYANISQPYFEMLDYLFVHKDVQAKKMSDLKGKIVAIPKGDYHIEEVKQFYPDLNILEVDRLSDAIDAVVERRADVLFETYAVLTYLLTKDGISDIVPFKSGRDTGMKSIHFLGQKDDPRLISVLNKALSTITPDERRAIYKRWLSDDEVNPTEELKFDLTDAEKKWLKTAPPITFAGDPAWLPFEGFTAKGEYVGIVSEYLKEIERRLPIHFEPRLVNSWLETLDLGRTGQVDVISGDYNDKVLLKHYRRITPYMTSPIVILMRQGEEFVDDLDDVSADKVGVIKGYGYVYELKRTYPDKVFVEEPSAEALLEDLAIGKLDVVVMTLPKASYILKEKNLFDVRIVGKTRVNLKLTLFVNKDQPELYSIIEKAVHQISPETKSKIVGKWTTLEFESKVDYLLIMQIAAFLLFVIAIVVYWNLKMAREIKQRKSLQRTLKENEEQLKLLLDSVPVSILVTSRLGKVLAANAKALGDYHLSETDLGKIDVNQFYENPRDRKEILKQIEKEGKIEQKVVSIRQPNDSFSPMMLSIQPIRFKGREALLTISVDISERLAIEAELHQAKESAEDANRAKSEFLANMSHEIRTPMNAILGFTELLCEEVKEPRLLSYVRTIQNAGQTLLSLINDILDLSKVEAGKLEIVKTTVNAHELFQDIVDIFTINAERKGLSLSLDIEPALPKVLWLDAVRLRQVLFNLIGNAVKFTEEGHIQIRVQIRNLEQVRSKLDLWIDVQDTGIGISEDQLETVFESFQQQSGQDTRKYGGTGLGLPISQRLVRLMGGELWVKSEPSKGSVFSIELNDVEIASVAPRASKVSSTALPWKSMFFQPAKVLVVDDVRDNRELVKQNLSKTGLTVVTAKNGKEAIDYLAKNVVDLVLMDIRMPVMDGYEATPIIKKEHPELPVVALTASVMQDERSKIIKENFDGYLRKPVDRKELFQVLSQYLAYSALEPKKEIFIDTLDTLAHQIEMQEMLVQWVKDLTPAYKLASRGNNIDAIKAFTTRVELSITESSPPAIKEYARGLTYALDGFNILALQQSLKEFEQLRATLLNKETAIE